MSRPMGSKNKDKVQETLFTHECKKCGWKVKTCIASAIFGHVCNGKGK